MSFLKKTGKALADVIPGLGRFVFDEDLGTILITSGTGVIGYRVAKSLLAAGHKSVHVGIWKGDRVIGEKSMAQTVADKLEGMGAEVVDFDWVKEDCYAEAVAGVRTVLCTLPHMEGWGSVFPAFLSARRQRWNISSRSPSSVRANATIPTDRTFLSSSSTVFAMISSMPPGVTLGSPAPLIHQGPSLRNDRKFVTASYGVGVNYVSPNDVADAAMVCLLDLKAHRNKTYNLSGPGPVRDVHVAKLLSKCFGYPIEHVSLGYHDYVEHFKSLGHPDWLVKDTTSLEKMKASGIDELVTSYTDDLKNVIGKDPETFADYLSNKEYMSPAWNWPTEEK